MQCREMLYGLCSLQTNLHISFHHQSNVLLHQGTTFEELLPSSEIRNAMEKQSEKGTSELRATKPEYWSWPLDGSTQWGVCLSSGQPGLTWYESLPPDTSTWGVHLRSGQPDLT